MTDDDIIRIAKAAGITLYTRVPIRNAKGDVVIEKCWHDRPTGCLFDFARRIRSETIAECAKVCDQQGERLDEAKQLLNNTHSLSAVIARGCASAIRALDKGAG